MRRTPLADQLVRAFSNENYRGVCPENAVHRNATFVVPIEIRAVVALWYRKRSLAKKKLRRCSCSFIYHQEAESLEYMVFNWLRTHYRLTRSHSISMSSRWRFSARRV